MGGFDDETKYKFGTEREYELMETIEQEVSCTHPNGIDSESVTVSNAIGVIRYLLKHDKSVKGYKLAKKPMKRRGDKHERT